MPSSSPTPKTWEDPLMFLHVPAGPIAALLMGIALGWPAARLMRARHLHWSWSAAVTALIVLVRPVLGGAALALGAAALSATMRGRRWHREDLRAGGDLAEIAARRSSPSTRLSAMVDRARHRLAGGAGGFGTRRDASGVRIGYDEHRREVRVPFAGPGAGRHTLVVGATGSGKTVTQTTMTVAAIERGMGAIVIDPKGDDDMRECLAEAARAAGRRFSEWSPNGHCIYNPYAEGSDTEIADKVLAGELFTEPHYLRQAQRYLGHVIRALRCTGGEISLREIVAQLEPERLELLARRLPAAAAASTFGYLDSLTSRQRRDLAGVRDRLAILVESDVGSWLDPSTDGARRVALPAAVRERAVVYFRLESDTRPLLAQMIGAAIVQDLQTTVAGLQGQPIPTAVVIDEFSAVAAEQVVRLFGRARSAGFSLMLGTQEISDLRLPGRERLLEQVMGNLSLLIAHRQVVPASAELIAAVAGSEGAWRVSQHSDGRTTRTRGRRPVLEPSRIMDLGTGWSAVLVLGAGGRACITRIDAEPRRG
jgi:Type IV secretion-system coupling protein DNA-binding domain